MPNLFIIGASKAGSSALHAYLRPHPDIAMSSEKEPCYFVDREELRAAWPIMARRPCSHDQGAYEALWHGGEGARYRGEGSVYYSQAPHRSCVPERIAAACPDARIVYTVRAPVDRAIKHWWQRAKEFQEPLPLDRAVRENALYRDTSDYAMQIEAYLRHFPPDRIHVVVAEDLRARRREVLGELTDWLGLARYDHSEDELTDRHRSPPTSRAARFPMVAWARDSALWAAARQRLPDRAVGALRRGATRSFDRAEVDETDARAWLTDYLAPRRAAFETLIGRHIDAWD